MGKHFIDPKSSEILSIFQVFPFTMQIALFWPKLLRGPKWFYDTLISLAALLKSWQKHCKYTNGMNGATHSQVSQSILLLYNYLAKIISVWLFSF
jgi:hypothetical protein